ncbi:hypothetical protein AMECASPLE_030448 [Ameca splendens]|uniref:Uncharacterized protein n=1 Tax=Ameca splendens TaxID=208324 RepID=A0ABV0ZQX5_9TELE
MYSCFLLSKCFSSCSLYTTTQSDVLQGLESLSAAKVISLERCFAAVDGMNHTSSGICNRDSELCVEAGRAACKCKGLAHFTLDTDSARPLDCVWDDAVKFAQ